MTRDLSLRLGYDYTARTTTTGVTEIHRPVIALDFLRALSLTRRTSLTFGVGTEATAYDGDDTLPTPPATPRCLTRLAARGRAAATYQRGTYFVDTFAEPLTGDSASVQLGGLITRRIQLQAVAAARSAGWAIARRSDFDSYRGTVTLSTAITRCMNVGVDYAYYRYEFETLSSSSRAWRSDDQPPERSRARELLGADLQQDEETNASR